MAKRRQRSDTRAGNFTDIDIYVPTDEDVFGELGTSDFENQPVEITELSGISTREMAKRRLEEARRVGASDEETAQLESKLQEAEVQLETYEQTAIVSVGEKGFVFRNFNLSKIGIDVTGEITEHDADALGYALKKVDSALQFWFGDWANLYLTDDMNDNQRGAIYDSLSDKFGIKHRTLNNYASICRMLGVSLRRETLPFSHHRIVAELPAILKGREGELLDKAVAGDGGKIWSVRRLREEIENECAKLDLSDAKTINIIDLTSVTKSFRSVAKLLTMDTSRLRNERRNELRQRISTLRQLLDEAEAKLDK